MRIILEKLRNLFIFVSNIYIFSYLFMDFCQKNGLDWIPLGIFRYHLSLPDNRVQI